MRYSLEKQTGSARPPLASARWLVVIMAAVLMAVVTWAATGALAPSFYQRPQLAPLMMTSPTPPLRLATALAHLGDRNPIADLREIFAVTPVLLLVDRPLAQLKRVEVALRKLSITPEMTVVDLLQHPNHAAINDYLENLSLWGGDGIPRLFIGGRPEATLDDILRWDGDGTLALTVRARGNGLISLGH